jgi:hypothetical protein
MTAELDQSRRQVELSMRDDLIFEYLRMDGWTPAMAALLSCGIRAPVGCTEIPGEGIGLDSQQLSGSSKEFHNARHVLKTWDDWREDAEQDGQEFVTDEIHPIGFFAWCEDEGIETEWLRLLRLLAGCPIEGTLEATSLLSLSASNNIDSGGARAPSPNVALTSVVHRLATRHNALTTAIGKAVEMVGSHIAADVFFQLQNLALEEFPPFTGEVEEDGLCYREGGKIKTLTKAKLSSRLQRRRALR